jgi:hypothetical protein
VAAAKRGEVDLGFLIAIVPDPEMTRLALYFDRSLASIQTGVASAGYRFDSLWAPWKQGGGGGGDDVARQPGVMVFRGEGVKALAVFLVGESPVAGIRRVAFRNALYYISELSAGPASGGVRIAGPNFSGSFESLREEIGTAARSGEFRLPPRFRVISPSSTVRKAQCAFGWPQGPRPAAVDYSAIRHHDDGALLQLGSYLEQHWGSGLKAALIAEGETAFGLQRTQQRSVVSPAAPAHCRAEAEAFDSFLGARTLNFPREISLLRNLYPDAGKQAFARPPGAGQEKGASDLQLRSGGRGALPVFAEQQTVASQESQLLQIAQTLDREGASIAGLAATDVLDLIYLAGYFRQAVPGVRLYMLDSDLLLVRATANYPLDGTLLVTDFPLLPDNRVWTRGADRTPFASGWEIGAYNAVRAQVLEARGNRSASLLEYASPFDTRLGHPPLWLTVVSKDSLWPLALLGGDEPPGTPSLQLHWPASADHPRATGIARPSLAWKAVLLALAALGLGAGLTIAAAQFRPPGGAAGWLEAFQLEVGAAGTAGRAYYLLSVCLLLATLLLLHLSPLIAAPGLTGGFRHYLWLGGGAAGVLGAAAVLTLYRGARHRFTPPREGGNETPALRHAYGALGLAAALCFCGFTWAWLLLFNAGAAASHEVFFRSYRALNPLSGVSPVLPFQFLALALLAMLLLQLRRHGLFIELHPLPPAPGNDLFLVRAGEAAAKLWRLLSWPLIGFRAAPFVLCSAAAVLLTIWILRGPQSLESNGYDWLYIIVLAAAIVLAFQTWARFLLVWGELKALLDALEAHPLRQTFSALPSEFGQVPLIGDADRSSSPLVFSRSIDVLRALTGRWDPQSGPFPESEEQLAEIERKTRDFLSGALPRRAVEDDFRQLAGRLSGWLEGHWRKGRAAREAKGEEETGAQSLAAEFIALRYTAYIRHVMLHLRSLLFVVALGFFLTVVSGLVYPFRSQHLLGWWATGGFILLGLPVAAALLQMDRNRLLRRLRSADGAEAPGRYLLRALLLAVPSLLALIGTHFPGLSRYAGNWLAPALQALSK